MKPLSKAMIFIIVLVCSAIVISAIVIPLVVIFVIKPAAEAAEAKTAQNGEHQRAGYNTRDAKQKAKVVGLIILIYQYEAFKQGHDIYNCPCLFCNCHISHCYSTCSYLCNKTSSRGSRSKNSPNGEHQRAGYNTWPVHLHPLLFSFLP